MAQAGVGSRRACEEIIRQGRVRVNGQTAVLGMKVNSQQDQISVDGKALGKKERRRYLILHKPVGYLTTVWDQFGRKSVLDLLKGVEERIYPVGRLDCDSEGLVFLTNDGALAYQVMHPKFELPKTYLVELEGQITEAAVRALTEGVVLADGPTAPAQVQIVQVKPQTSLLRLTLREGRNRQIRRMGAAVGFPVRSLFREAIGPLRLGGLSQGEFRDLKPAEIAKLKEAVRGAIIT